MTPTKNVIILEALDIFYSYMKYGVIGFGFKIKGFDLEVTWSLKNICRYQTKIICQISYFSITTLIHGMFGNTKIPIIHSSKVAAGTRRLIIYGSNDFKKSLFLTSQPPTLNQNLCCGLDQAKLTSHDFRSGSFLDDYHDPSAPAVGFSNALNPQNVFNAHGRKSRPLAQTTIERGSMLSWSSTIQFKPLLSILLEVPKQLATVTKLKIIY
ncbi:hypothetical protein NC653_039301 [Populus alba x Populus x berolinensis]|uniref:Uncharacterized protein n=1 Tax=Populus alba x Populus x berolinensis TaxID=444605 RepID=A0AAD6LDG4_9ROSI|nr:hypothetical protein NC653_039301 [Populus alba x Populus x berolinensis]